MRAFQTNGDGFATLAAHPTDGSVFILVRTTLGFRMGSCTVNGTSQIAVVARIDVTGTCVWAREVRTTSGTVWTGALAVASDGASLYVTSEWAGHYSEVTRLQTADGTQQASVRIEYMDVTMAARGDALYMAGSAQCRGFVLADGGTYFNTTAVGCNAGTNTSNGRTRGPAWLAKYDVSNPTAITLVWALASIDGAAVQGPSALATDDLGNVYMVGSFTGTMNWKAVGFGDLVDAGTTGLSATGHDGFLARFKDNGINDLLLHFPEDGPDGGVSLNGVAVQGTGVLFSGSCAGHLGLDAGIDCAQLGSTTALVGMVDSAGALQWINASVTADGFSTGVGLVKTTDNVPVAVVPFRGSLTGVTPMSTANPGVALIRYSTLSGSDHSPVGASVFSGTNITKDLGWMAAAPGPAGSLYFGAQYSGGGPVVLPNGLANPPDAGANLAAFVGLLAPP